MQHPGPVKGFLVGEFTYPILPPHEGGAMWFYSLPKHDNLCLPAETIYREYRGAVKYGNIFSLDVGPDYEGKLRPIDVETLRKVGEMIRNPPPGPAGRCRPARRSMPPAPGVGRALRPTRWWTAMICPVGTRRWAPAAAGWKSIWVRRCSSAGRWSRSWPIIARGSLPSSTRMASMEDAGRGSKNRRRADYNFPPVKAQFFRLNILEASEVPTIDEFQLFGVR